MDATTITALCGGIALIIGAVATAAAKILAAIKENRAASATDHVETQVKLDTIKDQTK